MGGFRSLSAIQLTTGFHTIPAGGSLPSQREDDRLETYIGDFVSFESFNCVVMSWPDAELPMMITL